MAAAGPTLTSFDAQPWWIVVLKAAFLLLTAMFTLWAERPLLGRMQNRPSPNRAGPFGLLQSCADAIKLALKEDIVPRRADKVLFYLAPATAPGLPGGDRSSSRSCRCGPGRGDPYRPAAVVTVLP